MHPRKRALLIVLFSIGTVGGFAHGFVSLGRSWASCRAERRRAFEDHVAEVCTRAAERVLGDRTATPRVRAAAEGIAPASSE